MQVLHFFMSLIVIENIPEGHGRETSKIVNQDEYTELFELAPPQRKFELYSESHWKRVKRRLTIDRRRPLGEPVEMDVQTHWEKIYSEKEPNAVSWYRAHLETSLELIERVASDVSASIIDVGGGESTLVDDLLGRGYHNITVLDVSQTAIDVNKRRLDTASDRIHWLVADVAKAELPPHAYDVWHDRAVFHFLTAMDDRIAYVRQVASAVKPGGHVLVSTFGPEGPTKCSGLDVVRYDAESLHKEFGVRFRLLDSCKELHRTPFGTSQQFLYCLCRLE